VRATGRVMVLHFSDWMGLVRWGTNQGGRKRLLAVCGHPATTPRHVRRPESSTIHGGVAAGWQAPPGGERGGALMRLALLVGNAGHVVGLLWPVAAHLLEGHPSAEEPVSRFTLLRKRRRDVALIDLGIVAGRVETAARRLDYAIERDVLVTISLSAVDLNAGNSWRPDSSVLHRPESEVIDRRPMSSPRLPGLMS
jgi:hypothetical protein